MNEVSTGCGSCYYYLNGRCTRADKCYGLQTTLIASNSIDYHSAIVAPADAEVSTNYFSNEDNIKRLEELLKSDPCPYPGSCNKKCKYIDDDCFAKRYAEYLDAHGVIAIKN